jgi:sugar/nucleoside kinase (ribokinase family)
MVVGGAVMDITSTFAAETAVDVKLPSSFLHTSCPGTVRQNLGGVGRNVAEAAFRSGTDTLLVSAVGSDLASSMLIDGIKKTGMV